MTLSLLSIIALIAVGLILVILIQNPKTGTLNNAHQLIGTAQSQKVVEKTTWGLATLMLLLCLVV